MDRTLTQALRDALLLALLLSLPAGGVALVVGLLVGAFQTATQIGGPSVSAVPRLVGVAGALALAGAWIGAHITRFAQSALETIAR